MSVHLKNWTVSRTTVDTEAIIDGAAPIPAAQGN
jgi:hypothetical protein